MPPLGSRCAARVQARWKTVDRHFPGPPNAPPAGDDGKSAQAEGGWGGYERSESMVSDNGTSPDS